jgi:hypothetical protein
VPVHQVSSVVVSYCQYVRLRVLYTGTCIRRFNARALCYAKQPSPKDRYCASLSAMMAVVPRASPRALASRLSYERTLSLRSLSTYWKLNEETGEYQRPIFVAATRQHVGEYLIGLCLCFIRFYGFVSPFCHCCLIFFTCTL